MKDYKGILVILIPVLFFGSIYYFSDDKTENEIITIEENTEEESYKGGFLGEEEESNSDIYRYVYENCEEYKKNVEEIIPDPELCECDFDVDEETSENPICTYEMVEEKKKNEQDELKEQKEEERKRSDKWTELCNKNYLDIRIAEECLWNHELAYCNEIMDEWYYDPFELEEKIKNSDDKVKYIERSKLEKCMFYILYYSYEDELSDHIYELEDELENLADEIYCY